MGFVAVDGFFDIAVESEDSDRVPREEGFRAH